MGLEDRAKTAAREVEVARLEENRRREEEHEKWRSRVEVDTRARIMEWFEDMGVQPVPIHYDGLKTVETFRDGDSSYHYVVEAHWQLEGHDYRIHCKAPGYNDPKFRPRPVQVRKSTPVHPDRECTECPHEPDWGMADDLTQLGATLRSDQPRVLPPNYGQPRVQHSRGASRRRWWGK